jgi:hypothetical protein
LKGIKACLKKVKETYNTIPFTKNIEMCENGCMPLSPDMTECSECKTSKNKDRQTFLKMVSIQDKMAKLLACDETRELVELYKTDFVDDGSYKDVFSGDIFKHIKSTGRYDNKHDLLLGLCVDAFSSKAGRQSMVLVYVVNFSLDPSIR